jgi:hypothetical protein
MFKNVIRKSFIFLDNVGEYCRARQTIDDNIIHGMLYTQEYKHTLRICNTYSFSMHQSLRERASMSCFLLL